MKTKGPAADRGSRQRERVSWHFFSLKFCCRAMRDEWGVLIGFGLKGHAQTIRRQVNIFTLHAYSSGPLVPGITGIWDSPWCGEEIEITRVK
jgi:hypothetical protein